jgi:hypothetical protein
METTCRNFRRRVALALLSSEDSAEPSETHGGTGGRENPLTGYLNSKLMSSGHTSLLLTVTLGTLAVVGARVILFSLHPKCFTFVK